MQMFDEVVFAILLNGDFFPISTLRPRAQLFIAGPMQSPTLRDNALPNDPSFGGC
jgi:hypothetical protein